MRSPKDVACKRFTVGTVEQDWTSSFQLQKKSAILLYLHDGAENCKGETYGSDRSSGTAHRRNQRGTRTRKHHINPINHTKSTIAINLHVVQSATATLRATHETTCAELLSRRYPRASDRQDALTFCPTERQSLTVGKWMQQLSVDPSPRGSSPEGGSTSGG